MLDRTDEVKRAFFIAESTEFKGDSEALLIGAMRSVRVLAKYAEELENQIESLYLISQRYDAL